MKPASHRQFEHGTTLVTTLVIVGVIASIFASYLTLVSSRTRLVFRAQAWDKCIAVCEAGVEEALSHLNKNGLTNMFSNGWTATNGAAARSRTIGDSYYALLISTNANSVVISATGYVPLPHALDKYINRRVKVTAQPKRQFPYAIVTEDKNEIAGTVDSFDSSNPLYSTGGLYDPTKARDKAFVGSNKKNKSKILKVKSKGKVYGNVAVGAGSTSDVSSKASVGDSVWVNGGSTGIQSGHSANDMNLSFPPVPVPFTGGYYTPGGGTVNGTNYLYHLQSGDYLLSELKLEEDQFIAVTGDARLLVNGKIETKDNSVIRIFSGGKLQLYAADEVKFAGVGVENQTGYASNFSLYGLPGNTKIEVKKKSKEPAAIIIGTIYAPSAKVEFKDETVLIGGSVSYELKMDKESLIHFDESLSGNSGAKFIITAWEEL